MLCRDFQTKLGQAQSRVGDPLFKNHSKYKLLMLNYLILFYPLHYLSSFLFYLIQTVKQTVKTHTMITDEFYCICHQDFNTVAIYLVTGFSFFVCSII